MTTDKIGPIISNVSPAKGAVVQEGKITFQADIIDVSSGYTLSRTTMEIDDVMQVAERLDSPGDPWQRHPGDDPGMTWTKIDDGWRMTYENDLGIPTSTVTVSPGASSPGTGPARRPLRTIPPSSNRLTMDGEDPELVTSRQCRAVIQDKDPHG